MKTALAVMIVAALTMVTGCAAPSAAVASPEPAVQSSAQSFLDGARSIHQRFADMPAADLLDAGHKLCEGIDKYGLSDYREFISDNSADAASRQAFDKLIVTASNTLC